MIKALHYFLIQNHKVTLPGIGCIYLDKTSAINNMVEKTIAPNTFRFLFKKEEDQETKKLFIHYAKTQLNISEKDINDYFSNATATLQQGQKLHLSGIGIIQQNKEDYIFTPDEIALSPTVNAERVVHSNEVHTVRVGEQEKTSTEMKALLSKEKSTSYWWAYVLVILIFLAGCGYLYYHYFYQK